MDADDPGLARALAAQGAQLVISTAGSFQARDYRVAKAAIEAGARYIDIADARALVTGIVSLDAAARQRGVLVASGASSVPALSSAVVDRFAGEFSELREIDIGISTAARMPGAATFAAVLGYGGKPFTQWHEGAWRTVHGWQGLRRHSFPGAHGTRGFGDCDVPDLAIFPARYPSARNVRFGAGVELRSSQLALWLLSWVVRSGIIRSAASGTPALRRIALWMQRFGTGRSAMFVELRGRGREGKEHVRQWEFLAHDDDGASIPCMAAVRLARNLAAGVIETRGAMPCVGLLALDEYLDELKDLKVKCR
jgi:saccharopine dehydrogenase-like NADP-dependent oxidoreductase